MGYLGSFAIDDTCTFYANSHTPATGAAVDADAVPGYRVYEDETGTPILTGSMALLDDTNTVGFYSEQITLSAANGFEVGKSYCVRITLVVGGVTGVQLEQLQVKAPLATAASIAAFVSGAGVNVTQLGGVTQSLTDLKDFADDGYDPATNKVQGVVLTDTVTTYTGNTPQTGDNFPRIGANGSGLTLLATAASIANFVSGTGVNVTQLAGNSQSLLDLQDFADAGYNPSNNKVLGVVTVDTTTTYTGNTPQTGDNFPRIGATGSGLTSLASAADLATLAAYVDTEVAAILAAVDTEIAAMKAIIDLLPNAGALTSLATAASITALNDLSATDVENAVWDATMASHLTAGTTGASLNGAGSAGDPWTTALPGAYGAGSAGAIVGTVPTILAAVDTEVAAIKAKTDNLPTDPADESSLQASIAAVQAFVDTEVAAIKTVTDLLPNGGALTSLATAASIAALNNLSMADIPAAIGMASGNMDVQLALLATAASIAALNNLSATDIENAAWDATMASHLTAGSTGASLNGAGAAGDPWTAALPGAYGAGTAGVLLSTLATLTLAAIEAAIATALATTTYAELGSVPASNAPLADKINWVFMALANPMLQTATLQTLRNRADSADVATATASSDGTTTTRGAFS